MAVSRSLLSNSSRTYKPRVREAAVCGAEMNISMQSNPRIHPRGLASIYNTKSTSCTTILLVAVHRWSASKQIGHSCDVGPADCKGPVRRWKGQAKNVNTPEDIQFAKPQMFESLLIDIGTSGTWGMEKV